jgi:curved DNA-binding protein CbpA
VNPPDRMNTRPTGTPPERPSEMPPSSARAGLDVLSQSDGELSRRGDERDAGADVITSLFRLVKVSTMHASDNLAVVQKVDEIVETVRAYTLRTGSNVSILFRDDTVLIGGQILQGNRTSYECARELGTLLARLGISDVGISRDVRPADFYALSTTLSEALRSTRGTRVPERPTPRIRLRAASPLLLRREGASDRDPAVNAAKAYASACVVLRRLYEALGKNEMVLPRRVKRVAQRLVDLSAGETPAFLGVTDAKRGGHDEAQRAVNATILTLAMARQITSDPILLSRIAMSALLCDVGRYHVAGAFPGSGRLVPQLGAEQERDVPATTAMLLTALGRVNEPSVMRTVMAYEACSVGRKTALGLPYDGARNPTLQAYLIAASRSYVDEVSASLGSPSRTADDAIARLTERWPDGLGRTALRLLIGALGLFPSGTLVELSTSEVAIVVATPADPSRYSLPRVRVVLDMAGHPVEPPFEVDLGNPEPGAPPRRIRRVMPGGSEAAAMSVRTPTSFPSSATARPAAPFPASSMLRNAPTIAPGDASTGETPVAPQRKSAVSATRPGARRWPDAMPSLEDSIDALPLPPLSPTRSAMPRISDVRVTTTGSLIARPSSPISAPPTKPDRPALGFELNPTWEPPDDDPDATPPSLGSPPGYDPDATPPSLGRFPTEDTLDSADDDDPPLASRDREALIPEVAKHNIWPAGPPPRDEPDDGARTRAYSPGDINLVAHTMPAPVELTAAIVEPVRPTPTAEGTFAKTPLVHLLVYMLDQRLTGTATFFPPDGLSHDIYFEQGVAAKIRMGAMVWPLDRVLLNLRLVDEARLAEALVDISKTKLLLGRHLVVKGLCSRENVLRALRLQLLQKLVSLCDLPSQTAYAFFAGENLIKSYGGPELLRSEPLATIMAAVRASPETPVVAATLARIARVPLGIVANAELARFDLSREETAVCDLLRAKRLRLAELVSAGVAPEQIVKRTVYALVITRHLDLGATQKLPVGLGPLIPAADITPPSRSADSARNASPPFVSPTLAPPRSDVAAPSSSSDGRSSDPRSSSPSNPNTNPQRTLQSATSGTPGSARAEAVVAILEPRESKTAATIPAPAPTPPSATTAAKPPPPRPLSPDLNARRDEIHTRASAVDTETYFEILGLAANASVEEARHSYFTLAKRWHPDRTPAELTDMKPLIARIFGKIGEAYATLGDVEKRGQYVKSLEAPGSVRSAAEEAQVVRAVNAALEFQKAEALLKKNDLNGAERHIRIASDADPGQPEYTTLLAWVAALRRGEPKNLAPGATTTHYDDLIQMLDEVLRGDPRYERALFYRGTLLKRSGRFEKAIRDFRLAAELNPRNLDALREVRLFDIRKREGRDQQGGQEQQGGIFGKWFKR